MERPKKPNIFKRHRDRGWGERKEKKQSRETRQNFWRKAAGSSVRRQYTKVPPGTRKAKRRAKNKRSRAARKVNRVS